MAAASSPVEIFISFAPVPADQEMLEEFERHMAPFRSKVELWHRGRVEPGKEPEPQVAAFLQRAAIILLFVSADYLASDACQAEAAQAFARHEKGEVRVIPIISRACVWRHAPWSRLGVLPEGGNPVANSIARDQVWTGVVEKLRDVLVPLVPGFALHKYSTAVGSSDGSAGNRELTPAYPGDPTRIRSEQLKHARNRKAKLKSIGASTAEADEEILRLRRQVRSGAQLRAGDALQKGRFLLVRRIGRGGFATVWEALDQEKNENVAIKVLHGELALDPIRRERLFRGARHMAQLAHSAVVRVIQCEGEEDGFYYFVMELIAGPNLRYAIIERQIDVDGALKAVIHVAEALAQAHEKGWVHRDVKPANILIDRTGTPKLTDFDLIGARDTTGGTRTGALGTFIYAAPELLDRPQEASAASDVYGLGMTLAFIFHGSDLPAEAFRRTDRFVDRLNCGASVKVLLKRATEWNQEERFRNADEFCRALCEATAPPPSLQPARQIERREEEELFAKDEQHRVALLRSYLEQASSARRVGDDATAAFAYSKIIEIDARHEFAYIELEDLYAGLSKFEDLLELHLTRFDISDDCHEKVKILYKVASVFDEQLQDKSQAFDALLTAFELDFDDVEAVRYLERMAAATNRWPELVQTANGWLLQQTDGRQFITLCLRLAKWYAEDLGHPEYAQVYYRKALEHDPNNEQALEGLERCYRQLRQWLDLINVYGRHIQATLDRAKKIDLWAAMAKVYAEEVQDLDRAIDAYLNIVNLDDANIPAQEALAKLYERQDDALKAIEYMSRVADLTQDSKQRVDMYYRIGKQLDDKLQAINNFEKALGINPAHIPTLEAMVSAYESLEDWKQVCHYKRQILDGIMDSGERFKILNDIAEIWINKENNVQKGIEALEEALELEPQHYALLHNVLQQYQKTDQWSQMVDTLQRIADIEPQPDRKSRYLFTMAQVHHDKLDGAMRAVDLFNEALDLNPGFLKAFERINGILTQRREWKQLERSYRKMLHRVAGKGNTDLEFNLWHGLGLICRDRLGDRTAGGEAFKMASRLKPEDMTEHLLLAEIYEQSDRFDAAIAEYQAMVKLDPMRVDLYKRLYRLHVDSKQYDPAWCVAGALAFLRKADQEEQQYFDDYRPQGMIQAKSRLHNQQWIENLFHEEENLYVGKIFEMLAGAALQAKIKTLEAQKQLPVLDPRFRQDPESSSVTFARTFGWAANVLGLPAPLLYVRSDVPGAIVAVPNAQPASVAGKTVLTGFSPQELTFICGKHLAMYRGEHYIKTLFPTVTELTLLLFTGLRLVAPETPLPQDIEKQIVLTARYLKQFMQPMQLEGLRMVVKQFFAEGAKANIKRWAQCVDITAARAGLLLCADLEIARNILGAELQFPTDLPPQEKLKELLVFSTSEHYFTLRRALGIAIGE